MSLNETRFTHRSKNKMYPSNISQVIINIKMPYTIEIPSMVLCVKFEYMYFQIIYRYLTNEKHYELPMFYVRIRYFDFFSPTKKKEVLIDKQILLI